MTLRYVRALASLTLAVAVWVTPVSTETGVRVTTPEAQFGHAIGADYELPDYTQLSEYWHKLDRESDRLRVADIGKTAEGRAQLMAVITAPENFAKLDRHRDIARRLALAEDLTDDEARRLAAEGKAIVWIDGGLHANEVLGAQQLMELVYQMTSASDAETLRILHDVIVLAVHANPDGHELVANWYMREREPARRSLAGIPRLYQKYAGHDNNRDFYIISQPETLNMARVQYREWFPQVVYNHHQTGPTGTVLFAPPFRDPFNYNFDPLVPLGIDLFGAAMHNRFAAEGKPGATMRRGSNYSTWWNGGLRTTAYFHNMIGLLTEAIGNPTPIAIPFVPPRQVPTGDLPYPITPQPWHFRQSIEYSMTANRAVLDLASRYKDTLLFNIYRMGRNSIERGSRDSWTVSPRRLEAVRAAVAADRPGAEIAPFNPSFTPGGHVEPTPDRYLDVLREPAQRDPRGYVISAGQADFPTAVRFVNALIKVGVTVHRATHAFEAGGKSYPAGSFIVRTAQAFRPHVLDMFEPQDHPHDLQHPGGPPVPPYDITGYTLAFQMGVVFDRLLDPFDGPFERVRDLVTPPPGRAIDTSNAAGYLLSHAANDSFVAINRLLQAGHSVSWVPGASQPGGVSLGRGGIFIPAGRSTRPLLTSLAQRLGLTFHGTSVAPAGLLPIKPVRIGLWDRYGGSAPSGWIRWVLEQFEFPFEVVYSPELDAGNLNSRFDVLIFPTDAIPWRDGGRPAWEERGPSPESIPPEYRSRLGYVTVARTVPQLQRFVEGGGTLIAIGNSTSVAMHFGLPLVNVLVEKTVTGDRPLPRERFYIPGSILRVAVDETAPLAWGLGPVADVMFDEDPAFRLRPEAAARGARAIAWYADARPLRSGWAWGQQHLDGAVAVADLPLGRGRVIVCAPEITFRAQPHGTFKFLFNGIYVRPAAAGEASAARRSAPSVTPERERAGDRPRR